VSMNEGAARYVSRLEAEAERQLAVLDRAKRQAIPFPRAEPSSGSLNLISADSLKPEPIRWLWRGWLAHGKLHVLAGAPGTGKTTSAMSIAASVSGGRALPCGQRPDRGTVVIWSGEDDPADTLIPRLIAAGADLSRVRFVGDFYQDGQRVPFDPARDVPKLATAIAGIDDVALLIVDPLVSAVSGDSHKNAEVRRGLAPLVELAAKIDAALLGITHYSKGTQGRDPLERVSGSLAFGALARVVMGTVKQETEDGQPQRMLLARAKSNIGPDGGGFAYTIEQVVLPEHGDLIASRIAWGEAVEGTARDLLAEPDAGDVATEGRDAAAWLRDLLSEGPMAAKEVQAATRSAGLAWRTVQRATRSAGVETRREGFGRSARYVWRLETSMRATCAPCAPHPENGVHGAHGGELARMEGSEALEL
jgi:putative DNA primase/helicase